MNAADFLQSGSASQGQPSAVDFLKGGSAPQAEKPPIDLSQVDPQYREMAALENEERAKTKTAPVKTSAVSFLKGEGEPDNKITLANVLHFFTGHFPDLKEESIPEVQRTDKGLEIHVPGTGSMSFLQDPVTAVAFGGFAGAKAAKPILGKVAAGVREAVGWMTGGASEVPGVIKGVGTKTIKAIETPEAAKRLKGWQAKGVDVPIKAEEFLKGADVSVSVAKAPLAELGESKTPIGETLQTDTVLQSAIIPGAKEFLEPASEKIARTFKSATDDIKRTFAPLSMGKEAKQTGAIMREKLADMAQRADVAEAALMKARKDFNKMDAPSKIAFMDNIEKGAVQADAALQSTANTIRNLLDTRRSQIQALGTGKLETFNENYFPHIWEDPEKATDMMRNWFGRKPLEGSKSFLKQRTIPTIEEGLEKGLKLVSDNPVDLTVLKLREMDKYLMAHETLNEMKNTGLAKFIKGDGRQEVDGWIKINDKIATVYAPKELQATTEKGTPIGTTILGHYYAPENAAAIINSYLKPGLRNKEWFRGYLGLSNIMNQAQLGLSAFHLGFTSFDAAISKAALGLNQMLGGSPVKGVTSVLSSPFAPLTTVFKGNKVLKEWYKPGSQGAEIGAVVDNLRLAGGRVRMDKFYQTRVTEKMIDSFRQGKLMGGVLRLPFAAIEMSMRPIMEQLVPRQKLGVFMDLASWRMDVLSAKGAGREEIRDHMQKIWDSVDNRMGQLVYDNLFWEKTTKDLGMASVRSLGWNLGTFRELGGGAIDLAKQGVKIAKGQRPEMTYRMAYTMALPVVVGSIGGMTNYLMTGEAPKELKDYFFPRTGRLDKDGNPERISFPSYMKDVYHYAHTPGKAIVNKLHPALGIIGDMLRNEDYYGTEIRNSDDPIMKQALDSVKHIGKQMTPFSIQGAAKRKETGTGIAGQALPFVGILQAPAYVTRTDIQNEIFDTLSKRKGHPTRSQAQFEKSQARQEIGQAHRDGDVDKFWTKVNEAVEKGHIKNDMTELRTLVKNQDLPSDIRAFAQLPKDDQERILTKMNKAEVSKFAWFANKEVLANVGDLSDAAEGFVNDFMEGKVKKPTYSAGKLVNLIAEQPIESVGSRQ